MFGGNFAPLGFAFCNGQLMSIAENSALFAILGTTYGGDGQTTFALPDLRGRGAVNFGNGAGLQPVVLGESGGAEQRTVTTAQIPAHTHTVSGSAALPCATSGGSADGPNGSIFAASSGHQDFAPATAADGSMAPMPVTGNTAPAGGSQPVATRSPYLGLSFIIAMEGIFPSRS